MPMKLGRLVVFGSARARIPDGKAHAPLAAVGVVSRHDDGRVWIAALQLHIVDPMGELRCEHFPVRKSGLGFLKALLLDLLFVRQPIRAPNEVMMPADVGALFLISRLG